jgi:hypothetical protein
MSWNGAGVFTRLYSWVTDYGNSLPINPTRIDADTNDIVSGLNNCLTRDGQGKPSANLNMNGFKMTNMAAATIAGDAVRYEQVGALALTQGVAASGAVAASGSNADITSLSALTTPVPQIRNIQPITAAIASNAITITPSALALEFRNTTLTNGAVTFVQGTPAALVIASTDSFGLVTAAGNQRIAILAINNAGTIELAATALYGGVSLDETGVITTATSSTTATGIKAANVRTGVAYRVIGFVDATFTTGTGWGSLALVQGCGGNAATSLGSLGYGQTLQNVFGSRTSGTTYYNTTGKPITVYANGSGSGGFLNCYLAANINGVVLLQNGSNSGTAGGTSYAGITFIVPPGDSYVVSVVGGAFISWVELR